MNVVVSQGIASQHFLSSFMYCFLTAGATDSLHTFSVPQIDRITVQANDYIGWFVIHDLYLLYKE